VEQIRGAWRYHLERSADGARRLAIERDIVGIAAEGGNVVLHLMEPACMSSSL
jgi:hypothetical protein